MTKSESRSSASWPERLSWTLGIGLLVSYGGARLWLDHSAERAVESFKELSEAHSDQSPPHFAATEESTPVVSSLAQEPILLQVSAPDMQRWSDGRKQAFEQLSAGNAAMPLALLSIEALGMEVPVYDGTEEWNLNRGAGWIKGTARVGTAGNIGVAAHRDGYFRALEDAQIGQTVTLQTVNESIEYRITEIRIVEPNAVEVLASTDQDTITLVTCYPFYYVGPAPKRFIVHAERLPSTGKVAVIRAAGS